MTRCHQFTVRIYTKDDIDPETVRRWITGHVGVHLEENGLHKGKPAKLNHYADAKLLMETDLVSSEKVKE